MNTDSALASATGAGLPGRAGGAGAAQPASTTSTIPYLITPISPAGAARRKLVNFQA